MVHWDCVSCPETRCRRTESSPEHLPQGLMLFLSVPSKMLDVIQDFKVATKQFEVCLHLNTMSYFKLYFWKGSNVGTHIPIIPNIWYLLWPIMTNYDHLGKMMNRLSNGSTSTGAFSATSSLTALAMKARIAAWVSSASPCDAFEKLRWNRNL